MQMTTRLVCAKNTTRKHERRFIQWYN